MHPFESTLLYWPTLFIFIFGIITLRIYIKDFRVVFVSALIKAIIYFIYFSFFFDGTFTFQDDLTYIDLGINYLDDGNNFYDLIFQMDELRNMFSSRHILYPLINVFAFNLFGEYYFSPVALNVCITFVTAFFLYKILLLTNIKYKYAIYFSIFYLLYWDTVNWSSMVNFKDLFVQQISIALIYNILKFEMNKKILNIISITLLVLLLGTIRFYIPFLVLFSYLLYKVLLILSKYKIKTKIIFLIFFIILFTILVLLFRIYFTSEIEHFMIDFTNPILGSIRFLLTPVPFQMDQEYSFLFFASILNWLSIPFLICGAYKFFKLSEFKIILFIFSYLFIIVLFYGSYGELQGPRHRVQIVPYLASLQLLGFLAISYKGRVKKIFFR